MTKEVVVDDDGLHELARGVEWYESERAGLGEGRSSLATTRPEALPLSSIASAT